MEQLQIERISKIASLLVDQKKSRVVVSPKKKASGYWFGAGNIIEVGNDLILCGRYRNAGDSRTGLNLGERGLEWSMFRSSDRGNTWEKIISRDKESLSQNGEKVISIEGSSLLKTDSGYTLFISTEKEKQYPEGFESFKKKGTGVWSIDTISSLTLEGLATAPVKPFLISTTAEHLHIKDPAIYSLDSGELVMLFSHHPYNWASSNTGMISFNNLKADLEHINWNFLPRGNTWDVAISRGTALWNIPRCGVFQESEPFSLIMYDGGECMLPLDSHSEENNINKGYSCEELGGLALYSGSPLIYKDRISLHTPMFISHSGTGCSRYVSLLQTKDGIYCSWQQSGQLGEQSLVLNFVTNEQILTILS